MYKKFFGLKESPFNVNPDPRYLFLTSHTQEALACLTYGIETRKGFILLTGEVGTGKTTLINKLLEWLHKERVFTAFVFNPRLSVSQFFDFMMADFGIPCESHQKGQMLVKLTPAAIFPNCPRYIPQLNLIEPSIYAPTHGVEPLEPAWKNFETFKDVVPPRRR